MASFMCGTNGLRSIATERRPSIELTFDLVLVESVWDVPGREGRVGVSAIARGSSTSRWRRQPSWDARKRVFSSVSRDSLTLSTPRCSPRWWILAQRRRLGLQLF